MRTARQLIGWVITAVSVAALGGCAASDAQRQKLQLGYEALEQKQYEQAMSSADAYLQSHPQGPGSAEAMYLRGRAIYGQGGAGSLQEARNCYVRALTLSPSPNLEGLIRADLANCAYWQEDYVSAEREWSAAYDKLQRDEDRAWVLYRVGLSRQRQGRWKDADGVFAAVQQRYPNTLPGKRAREHQGATAFYVQVGTYRNPTGADAVIKGIQGMGLAASRSVRPETGYTVVLVGPAQTYAQAAGIKKQLAGQYPDALIVP